jgi:16S rRNA (cytidine1402-2'-O)-methyltransferase
MLLLSPSPAMHTPPTLYLIPTSLGLPADVALIPPGVLHLALGLRHWAVEEVRTARRFLAGCHRWGAGQPQVHPSDTPPGAWPHTADALLADCTFWDAKADWQTAVEVLMDCQRTGRSLGLLSEAGMPATADPGAVWVRAAHELGLRVSPCVGPSSLLLALAASGLNGQCFGFWGYLPRESLARRARLRDLEAQARQTGGTQLWIETPHRNDALWADALACLRSDTWLGVAADITLPTQYIRTLPVAHWQALVPDTPPLGKRPAVFCLGPEPGSAPIAIQSAKRGHARGRRR